MHVGDAEHRSVWLQGEAGAERPGVKGVESEPIDELQDFGKGDGVIAGGSHGEAIRSAPWTTPLFEFEVAEVVEALDHPR